MRTPFSGRIAAAMILLVAPLCLLAQTDEIQVYDAAIAEPGVFNFMLHSNFTPIGRAAPAFPGAIIPDQSLNGTGEWAYGVTPWFEQGLYLPVWTPFSQGRGFSLDGFKIRELFVRPHAEDHEFFYGLNFEFSVNRSYWEPRLITSELRPIIGVHLHPAHLHQIDLIVNPIVDTDYRGGVGGLEFVPAERVAYNLNKVWTVAIEEYADMGPLHQFLPVNNQFHEVWGVMDHATKYVNIEFGVGVGVTPAADRLTIKLMLSRDLNPKGKD